MNSLFNNKIVFSIIAISFTSSLVIADDFPIIKEGLWATEVTSKTQNSKTKMKQCFGNSESIKDMFESTKKNLQGICSDFKTEGSGSTFTSTVTCDMGFMKVQSTSTATGDFSKEYKVTTTSVMTPAIAGANGEISIINSKYIGECEPGMKPGDMITSDGKKMNVNDAAQQLGNNSQKMKDIKENMKNVDMQKIQQMQQQIQEMMKNK